MPLNKLIDQEALNFISANSQKSNKKFQKVTAEKKFGAKSDKFDAKSDESTRSGTEHVKSEFVTPVKILPIKTEKEPVKIVKNESLVIKAEADPVQPKATEGIVQNGKAIPSKLIQAEYDI